MQTDRRHRQSIGRKVGPDRCLLRRSNVARGLGVLAVLVILSALLSSTVAAQETQLGQLCWKIDTPAGQPPVTDTLRLALAQLPVATANDALMFEVFARWRATASAVQQTVGGPGLTYQLLGAGTLALENVQPPANIELGFEAVQNTTGAFGGNLSCNFFASLSLATLNGPWRIQCAGAPGAATGYTSNGTLTFQAAGCPNAEF